MHMFLLRGGIRQGDMLKNLLHLGSSHKTQNIGDTKVCIKGGK